MSEPPEDAPHQPEEKPRRAPRDRNKQWQLIFQGVGAVVAAVTVVFVALTFFGRNTVPAPPGPAATTTASAVPTLGTA